MTRFKYPLDGLYSPTRLYFEGGKNKISIAINNCSYNVPIGFTHRSYLSNLKSVLTNMKREIDVIERLLKKNDLTYKNMSADILSDTSKMIVNNIQERERMIK